MKTSNQLILVLYLGVFIWELLYFGDGSTINLIITLIPAFLITGTEFSNKLKDKYFNISWICISVLYAFIPIISSKMDVEQYEYKYLLPISSTIYFHISRQLFKFIFHREPIYINRLLEMGLPDKESKRKSDGIDLLNSLFVSFGFLFIIVIFLSFTIER